MLIGSVLRNRYKIRSLLGSGGFGDTYLAEDLDLPGHPRCVVKHLSPKDPDPSVLPLARRLFDTEAQVLYRLGQHPQIPQLLAHFEDHQEFYLVQEFVEGHDLSQELLPGQRWKEDSVLTLLQEILEVLAFVHEQHKVIHRDLKPQNIMRRKQDGKVVLIDFGAVKEVGTQFVKKGVQASLTVAIGTPGYMPGEQAKGQPRLSSDVYAVGMIGIFALTGIDPSSGELQEDPHTGEVIWQNEARVSREFAYVINRMASAHFPQRYASARDALQTLLGTTNQPAKSIPLPKTQPLKPVIQSSRRPFRKVMLIAGFIVALSLPSLLFMPEIRRLLPFVTSLPVSVESLIVIQPQFDAADSFSKGLARIKVGEKYGFIDKNGNLIAQPKFDEVGSFSEELVGVRIGKEYDFIDKNGDFISQSKFDQVYNFSEGMAVVKTGGKYGFIDKYGKIIIQPQFDAANGFSEGLATIEIGRECGFIDKSGVIIIQLQFKCEHFVPVTNPEAPVTNPEADGAIDQSGNSYYPTPNFSEGLAIVMIGKKYGYIDKNGNIIIQPKFDDVDSFSEGLATVAVGKKYGLIDKNGNFVVQPQFDDIGSFSEGLATVAVGKKHGLIDKNGRIVIQPQFDDIGSFSEGLATVTVGKKYGFIDKKGNFVVQPQFDFVGSFSEGLASVTIGKKHGFTDRNGRTVIQPQFSDVGSFSEGLAPVKIGEKWGYIRNPLN